MKQTNRTILFEEVNPEQTDLFTMIGSSRRAISLTDETMKELEKKFLVHDYEEFLQKFEPTLYLELDTDRESYRFFHAKTDADGKPLVAISLRHENALMNMLTEMLAQKSTGRIPRGSIGRLADYILPRQDFALLQRLRSDLQKLYKSGQEHRARQRLDETEEQWKNPLLQLQFLLLEGEHLLRHMEQEEGTVYLEEKANMQVKILHRSAEYEQTEPEMTEQETQTFADWLQHTLRQSTAAVKECAYFNLIGARNCQKLDVETYAACYNRCLALYGRLLRDYWTFARGRVQTLLGIQAFFLRREGTAKAPALWITNASPTQLLVGENRERLRVFLETVNEKTTYADTIWYAILTQKEKEDISQALGMAAEILAEYKIQTFLGSSPEEKHGFRSFLSEGMDEYYDSFQPFAGMKNDEFLVPCYPNFCILGSRQAKADIGQQMEVDEVRQRRLCAGRRKQVWLQSLFVESAYAAAGLMAAHTEGIDAAGQIYRTCFTRETLCKDSRLRQKAEREGSGILFGYEKNEISVMTDKTMAFWHGNPVRVSQVKEKTILERGIDNE